MSLLLPVRKHRLEHVSSEQDILNTLNTFQKGHENKYSNNRVLRGPKAEVLKVQKMAKRTVLNTSLPIVKTPEKMEKIDVNNKDTMTPLAEANNESVLPIADCICNPNEEYDTPSDDNARYEFQQKEFDKENNEENNFYDDDCGHTVANSDEKNVIDEILSFISPETTQEIDLLNASKHDDSNNAVPEIELVPVLTADKPEIRIIEGEMENGENDLDINENVSQSVNSISETSSKIESSISDASLSLQRSVDIFNKNELLKLYEISEISTASDIFKPDDVNKYKYKSLQSYIDGYILSGNCKYTTVSTPHKYQVFTPGILGDISSFESPYLKCSKSQIAKFQLPAFVINCLNNTTLDWYQRRFTYDKADPSIGPSLQIAALRTIYTYNKEQQKKIENEKMQLLLEEAEALSGNKHKSDIIKNSNFKPQPEYKKGWPVLVIDMDLTLLHSSENPKMLCDNATYLDKLRRATRKLEWLYDPSGKNMSEHEITAEHCRQSKSLKSISSTYSPSDVISAVIPSDIYPNKCTDYFPFCCYRPYCLDFLAWASRRFELILWTASTESYAKPRLDYLGLNYFFDEILYRESCTDVELNGMHIYVKDLEKLNRKMDDILLLDDTICCGAFQPDRLIPLKPFKVSEGKCETQDNSTSDEELLVVMKFLNSLLYARQRGVSIGSQMTESFSNSVVYKVWNLMNNEKKEVLAKDKLFEKESMAHAAPLPITATD